MKDSGISPVRFPKTKDVEQKDHTESVLADIEKFENSKDEIPLIPILRRKVEVDFNEIRFKNFLYTVVIPRQAEIQFKFYDQRRITGLPLALKVEADKIELRSWLGVIGKLWGRISCASTMLWEQSGYPSTEIVVNKSASPSTIYSIKEIKNFLCALKNNGYEVDQQIAQLRQFVENYRPPKRGLIYKTTFGCLFIWGYFTLVWLVPLIVYHYLPGLGFPSFIALIIGFPIFLVMARLQNKRLKRKI